jgi:hypothetical protein
MHPVYLLAFGTLVAVAAFGYWNYVSTREHQKSGGHTTGIGGPNDPMAGSTPNMRDPDEMRAALDAANARREGPTAGAHS